MTLTSEREVDLRAEHPTMDRTFLVVISRNHGFYHAYVPDVPGCAASGTSEEETLDRLKLAMKEILEAMKRAGMEFPVQSAVAHRLIVDEMVK